MTPDGRNVMSGSTDKIRIIMFRKVKSKKNLIDNVCVTPDGKYVVSGSREESISVTRIQDGKLVDTIKWDNADEIRVTKW